MQVAVIFPSEPTIKQPMVFDKQLGEGKFKVYLVKSSTLNTQYALKVFSRDYTLRHHYSREKAAISKLDHPNIIKYVPILSHNFRMDIMLTEYTPNGDLFDFVTKGCLENETVIRSYFHQLIEGLEYLHDQGIAHLDLKLENLLLDINYALKIIDFDQAQSVTDEKLCAPGTTNYRAPELRSKTCKSFCPLDIYAAGVILFAFKVCEHPFEESDDDNVKEVIGYDKFVEKNEEYWKEKAEKKGDKDFFSPEFIELLNGMLKENPSERFTIDDIKKSKWYNGPTYTMDELRKEIEEVIAKLTK